MCGVGLIYSKKLSQESREQVANKMHLSIQHRGPDDFGVWSNSEGLSIFHRRLSIVDLSPAGHQPMISSNQRWVISYNGEIYNHLELRQLLQDKITSWKGTSDTEVLLNLVDVFGPMQAIQKCKGMFAIILWDQQEKKLYLLRDRIGEKPLYYGYVGSDFVVGSELKEFHSHPDFSKQLNDQAVASFFKYNYVPAPLSIFKNIHKVVPGKIYKFDLNNSENPEIKTYWQLPSYLEQKPSALSYDETKEKIKKHLLSAVADQMKADVPLGVFLSGGVDSSLICALMTKLHSKQVHSFSIGFSDVNYDESPFAKAVAQHLGTHHEEMIVTGQDCLSVIEKIPYVYDEPFSDSSQVPTFLLSQMTRKHVTVALSGDGGDELFAGYTRYQWTKKIWKKMNHIPSFVRPSVAELGSRFDSDQWDAFYSGLNKLLGSKKKIDQFGNKVTKGFDLLKSTNMLELHDRVLSHWFQPQDLLLSRQGFSLQSHTAVDEKDFEKYMMWHDQKHYLPDDIMVKVDRASMAHSLETRAPFLDHHLIDFVLSSPAEFARNPLNPKKIIKDILFEYVPAQLIERPKKGFAIPIREWFKGDLRELTLDLLREDFLKKQNIFDAKFVSQFAENQINKNLTHPYHLWDLLMFQLWCRKWLTG